MRIKNPCIILRHQLNVTFVGCLLVVYMLFNNRGTHIHLRPNSSNVHGYERATSKMKNIETNHDCQGQHLRRTTPTGQWQIIEPEVTYGYSCHVDPRLDNVTRLRVFGMMRDTQFENIDKRNFYCQLWLHGWSGPLVATADVIREGNPKKGSYHSVQFICDFPSNLQKLHNSSVSIVRRHCQSPQCAFMVNHNSGSGFHRNFSVCVHGPLKFNYSDHQRLVEWIEINRLLGAEMFYIYIQNASKVLDPYLEYYRTRGLLEVLPWHLPDTIQNPESKWTMWNFMQMALVQDCLYRNMLVARHVAYIDLDEVIAPTSPGLYTWHDVIEQSRCGDDPVSYVARNTYFALNWEDDNKFQNKRSMEQKLSLASVLKTKRSNVIFNRFDRAKYIVIPHLVVTLEIHSVDEVWGGGRERERDCVLVPEVALLFHYRTLRKKKIPDGGWMVDRTMHKYHRRLLIRCREVYAHISDKEV